MPFFKGTVEISLLGHRCYQNCTKQHFLSFNPAENLSLFFLRADEKSLVIAVVVVGGFVENKSKLSTNGFSLALKEIL